ncbi:hypothetical protein [Streptomyces sp. NPDC094468]|uniref:hypothetical protein n=1 Tax=Streptomyces sp. NPDC094468 TaxID=3366066 RepID=UPI0038092505
MPMMPGMGGGGAQGNNMVEPSDASGLLDATDEPWTGGPVTSEEPEEGGTPAGGEGLGIPINQENEAPFAQGLPMMPGIPGGNPSSNTAASEPSEASVLLEPDSEPWIGEPDVTEEMVGGAEAGGEGLAGLDVEPDTEESVPVTTDAPIVAGGQPVAPKLPHSQEESEASNLLISEGLPWSSELDAEDDQLAVNVRAHPDETSALNMLQGAVAGAVATSGAGTGVDDSTAEVNPRTRRHRNQAAMIPPVLRDDEGKPAPSASHSVAPDLDGGEDEVAWPNPSQVSIPAASNPGEPVGYVARTPESEEENAEAWDSEGAEFVPFLWTMPTDNEKAVRAPGYSTEDEQTWKGSSNSDHRAETGGPRLSTWRPNRLTQSPPGELATPEMPLRSFAGNSSDFNEEEENLHALLQEDIEEDLEQPRRGFADLLVQDGDTWGSATSDSAGAVQ